MGCPRPGEGTGIGRVSLTSEQRARESQRLDRSFEVGVANFERKVSSEIRQHCMPGNTSSPKFLKKVCQAT